jgi:hypothetical protein
MVSTLLSGLGRYSRHRRRRPRAARAPTGDPAPPSFHAFVALRRVILGYFAESALPIPRDINHLHLPVRMPRRYVTLPCPEVPPGLPERRREAERESVVLCQVQIRGYNASTADISQYARDTVEYDVSTHASDDSICDVISCPPRSAS